MRILHVLGKLDRGGAETWLVQLLRHTDRREYEMDFIVHSEQPAAYDEEVRALGARIFPCLSPSEPLRYARNFRRILQATGPYDVVHSHVHHFSGYVLMLAAMGGVPIRIAHSHSDTRSVEQDRGRVRRAYLAAMQKMIQTFATGGLTVSSEAGDDLFAANWRKSPRWKLHHLGIDLSRFSIRVDRKAIRRELGLPEGARVIGHVGRFNEQKNHAFLVEIAREIVKREPRVVFLLVGGGPLRETTERLVRAFGMEKNFRFAGLRPDIPALMTGAMDAFLFPSLYEGLPIALLEAQAAGLHCVISKTISPEADVVPDLIVREALTAAPYTWANHVLNQLSRTDFMEFPAIRERMNERSIETSSERLLSLYASFSSI